MTLSSLQVPLWVFDAAQMRVVWANNTALDYWCAQDSEELLTRDMSLGVPETTRSRLQESIRQCYDTGSAVTELWTLDEGGSAPRTGELSLTRFPVGDNHQTVLMQLITDFSDTDEPLLLGNTALNHTAAMISLYDTEYTLLYANPAAQRTLTERCLTLEERLVNDTDIYMIQELLETQDSCTVELEVQTVEGPRWHSMVIRLVPQAVTGEEALLVTATDSTERRHAQQVAYKLAYTDSLTGLPNRAAMSIYLDELLSEESKHSARFGLFFLDLDRFKIINDSLGHAVGDQLLVEVAHRLKKSAGAHGMVSRLGGDEFVAIINGQTDIDHLRDMAQAVLLAMSDPLQLADQNLRILPSIGICRFPEDGDTVAELMEHADAAMYLAKAHQSGFCFFDEKMATSLSESVKDRLGLENDLVAAVKNHQFELYYQPKISSRNLTVVGVEGLIRWNHPSRGMVPPDDFIKIAEETGQIIEMGNWVLNSAMAQQRKWHDAGFQIPVSINISPRQFQDDELVLNVSESLLRNSCDPAMIELEITESMLLGDAEKIHQTLQQLSAMGIKLALDDFGTGYSNLAYLQKYPLDTLKIDRVFLADQKRSMLMGTILNMGKVLGLNVVAEGVETSSQADWLIARGCDQLQGYYFSQPIPVDQATQFLIDNGASRTPSYTKAA